MAFQTARDPQQVRLYLLAVILFISYLCVAIALPVIPVHVTTTLGLGNGWAGLGVGIAFLATILTRGHAGALCDEHGAKVAVRRGLTLYSIGALISLASGLLSAEPFIAFAVLSVGRLSIGLGESLVAVGTISWGIGMVGPDRSGKVMALVGAAMYGALAFGGPVGLLLLDHVGFAGAMAVSFVLPLAGLVAIRAIPAVAPPPARERPPLRVVIGTIWMHGMIVCLQGIGFAGIGSFFALYFRDQHWGMAGLGLTAFGSGFVLVRILFGNLPDRFGGVTVAIVSLAVEAVGQFLVWGSVGPHLALAGAFMTGLGCSMIYPAMGREVVQLVAPHLRGTALGGFSAFQDIAYGLTGPLAGLLADRSGYGSVFLTGAIAAVIGFVIAVLLRRRHALMTA
ncbi:arabinose transporter [Neorhizobium sp. NCHU2750]|uniref:arabinose transporter n=1 Tax=Neorhizobium sp. NCHU2750 TaxID=1825976 RepID=UPI000E76D0C4|nr:membrane protein [Neorhizobium sp. NCHU2750]